MRSNGDRPGLRSRSREGQSLAGAAAVEVDQKCLVRDVVQVAAEDWSEVE